MLSPFARAVTFYLGGGFALALLCGAWFFDLTPDTDEPWQRRTRWRAKVLAALGFAHPVVALTAVGLAKDLGRAGAEVTGLFAAVTVSLLTSLAVMATLFLATT